MNLIRRSYENDVTVGDFVESTVNLSAYVLTASLPPATQASSRKIATFRNFLVNWLEKISKNLIHFSNN